MNLNAPTSGLLAPLTPQQEQQLMAYQQQLAAPMPTPASDPQPAPQATGQALAAMAPPQQQSAPVGPALQATAPSQPRASLSAYLAAGGTDLRSIYPSLPPEEQSFIDSMRSDGMGGQMESTPDRMLKALDTHLKQVRASQVQTLTTSDGRKIETWNGQIIPNERHAKPEIITGEDGTQYFASAGTGTASPILDQNGQPVKKERRLSVTQTNTASLYQGMLNAASSKFQLLAEMPDDQKVTWDKDAMAYTPSMFGISVKAEREKLLKEQKDSEDKLNAILNPVRPKESAAPAATEVSRRTADGRVAIFDSRTKKFLRYGP